MPGERRKVKVGGVRGFIERAGIYDVTFIPAETPSAFEELHEELYEEFSPVGITEERLVQRLAILYLERDRLHRYVQFKMEDRRTELEREVPVNRMYKNMKSAATRAQVVKLAKEVEELAEGGGRQLEIVPPRHRDLQALFEEIADLPDGHSSGRDLFLKLVEEFPITDRLKQLEQTDVVIDRTIKRLMQFKTMKQMFRQLEPKEVESRKVATSKSENTDETG
jgi:hypothetical protein